jgi:hypothetical protein
VDAKPVQFLLVGEIDDAGGRPDDAPVEGHSSVPQFQDLDRVPQILAEIVEEDIAKAPAKDDAERGIENEVVGVPSRERGTGLLQQLQQVPVANENAREIGKAVPAKIEGPDVQCDWREAQIRERNEAAIVDGLQGLPHQSSAPHKTRARKGKGAVGHP